MGSIKHRPHENIDMEYSSLPMDMEYGNKNKMVQNSIQTAENTNIMFVMFSNGTSPQNVQM